MRRVTATPFGPWVTMVSTGSREIWRVTDVCACATAAANTGAKAIKLKDAIVGLIAVGLIAKPPGQASCRAPAQRRTAGSVPDCSGIGDRRATLWQNHDRAKIRQTGGV